MQGKGEEEEAYIPLLDVIDDSGKGELKPESVADVAQPFVFKAQPPSQNGSEKDEPSTSGRKDLPWSRASKQIKSPTLRLHHGRLGQQSNEIILERRAALLGPPISWGVGSARMQLLPQSTDLLSLVQLNDIPAALLWYQHSSRVINSHVFCPPDRDSLPSMIVLER